MSRAKEGEATRNRLADALMELMEGRNPATIKIRELTDRAGIDRQTFYHHFTDIYELAEYTYDREVVRLFNVESVDEAYESMNAYKHTLRIMRLLGDSSMSLRRLVSFINSRNPRGHFFEHIKRIASISHSVRLRRAGWDEKNVQLFEDIWTTAVSAVVVSWLRGEIALTPEEMTYILASRSDYMVDGMLGQITHPVYKRHQA